MFKTIGKYMGKIQEKLLGSKFVKVYLKRHSFKHFCIRLLLLVISIHINENVQRLEGEYC